jgi:hypothetical protein
MTFPRWTGLSIRRRRARPRWWLLVRAGRPGAGWRWLWRRRPRVHWVETPGAGGFRRQVGFQPGEAVFNFRQQVGGQEMAVSC